MYFGTVPTWKTKKGKTTKFVDAGVYNRNEREGNWPLGMGRQRGVERKKITLGPKRCENIKNLYIIKQIIDIIISSRTSSTNSRNRSVKFNYIHGL